MPKRILIMPMYGIGDALMSTPALRNLKERTGAHITYLHMFGSTFDAMELNPCVDENIHFPFFEKGAPASMRFLLGLRGKHDVSINFYPSNRAAYNISALVAGCPVRIGHRYANRDLREMNFLKNRTVMEDDGIHNVEEDMRLLGFLDINDPEPYPLEIHLSEDDEAFASGWYRDNAPGGAPYVGFHPGSSLFKDHSIKRWPKERYVEVIKSTALEHPEAVFLIFGGPEEDALKQEIRASAGLGGRVIPVSTGSIRQTAAVMKRCSAMVSNDSGLMHLSAALQVPTVAIFGPTNPVSLAPWGVRRRVLRADDVCGPCFIYSPKPMHCDAETYGICILSVKTGDVLKALSSLL